MIPELLDEDLDEYVPIDPLLREPLDLYGARARRRHLVEAVAHQAAVPWRLESDGRSPMSARVLYRLIDPLTAALDVQRVSINERAEASARDALRGIAGRDLVGVAIDFGLSNESIGPCALYELDRVVELLVRRKLIELVIRLLRRWERSGYVSDLHA